MEGNGNSEGFGMSDAEKEVWDIGDADELADLIDRGALQKLVNSHVLTASKDFMAELCLNLSGDDVEILDIDITEDVVATHSLEVLLDEQLDMYAADDAHAGPASALESAKRTLAVLEGAIEKYRRAVSGWTVEEDEEG